MKSFLSIIMILAFLYGCEKNDPPACEIISPENGTEIFSGEVALISVDANDQDGSIQEVRLYINNMIISTVEDPPYSFSWETAEAELGSHIIRVVAVDNENAEGEASIEIVIVAAPADEQAPVVELITPVEEERVSGQIDIIASVTDNVDVDYVDFLIKQEEWVVFEKDSTASLSEYSASLNTADYPDGLLLLAVAAYDAAGNCGDHQFNVYIDNAGDTIVPFVEILSPLNNDTVSGYVVLRARATDNAWVDRVDFNILKGTWELIGTDNYALENNEFAILWDTKNIPDGSYGIEAVAWDPVANRGIDRIGITIDNSGSVAGDDSFIYEKRKYYFKTFGTQTWMVENLAYMPDVGCSGYGTDSHKCYWVYDYLGGSRDIARHLENYEVFGILYNWEAARTACPPGWHLPSDAEWKTLEKYLGMNSSDADASGWRNSGYLGLQMKSSSGWSDNGNGDNSSEFKALPAGYHSPETGFGLLGSMADFWTSTGGNTGESDLAWGRTLRSHQDGIFRSAYDPDHGFSVRCVRDD
jgi:uncharacterized protein (TIGR02145 family)